MCVVWALIAHKKTRKSNWTLGLLGSSITAVICLPCETYSML